MDKRTFSNLQGGLHRIQDPVIRAVVWHQAYQMLMDQRISSTEYFNFTMAQLPLENDEEIVLIALKNLKDVVDFYLPLS